MTNRPRPNTHQIHHSEPAERHQDDPPIRLAHVLFILWVAGSVAWAFHAAMVAYNQGWWELRPELGALLVLTPPVLAHLLAIFVIRITGNPKLR